jgi:hypothetical protein
MPFLGSKSVLKDQLCDEMIEKRAPLPWVEAHDQPRRGAEENENGAPGAELSSQTLHKPPYTITTTSRILTVICLHPGKKVDTFNTRFQINNTTKHNASDRIHKS